MPEYASSQVSEKYFGDLLCGAIKEFCDLETKLQIHGDSDEERVKEA